MQGQPKSSKMCFVTVDLIRNDQRSYCTISGIYSCAQWKIFLSFFFKDGSKRKRQSLTKSYHHSTQEHYLSITQNYLETGHKILD